MGEIPRQYLDMSATGRGLRVNTKSSSVNSCKNSGFGTFDNTSHLFSSLCKCISMNADCLMNKRTELLAKIELSDPDTVAIMDVKPKHYRYPVHECEINLEGYECFHNIEKHNRGIALFVKTFSEQFKNDFEESVFVESQLSASFFKIGLDAHWKDQQTKFDPLSLQ